MALCGFRPTLLAAAIMFTGPLSALAADPPKDVPTPLSQLFGTIQAQEANFPLPSPEQSVVIAAIDVSDSPWGTINFAIPRYGDGSTHQVLQRRPGPCPPEKGGEAAPKPRPQPDPIPVLGNGPCLWAMDMPNNGGDLRVSNIKNLNVGFTIKWPTSANDTRRSIVIELGSQSQTVNSGTTEVFFKGVSQTTLPLTVTVNGGLISGGVPIPAKIPGILPLKVTWSTVAAGGMTIPVLPISIVYAPLVDPDKKNTASAAISSTTGNTTTLSLSSSNGLAMPVPSTFQNSVDIATDMGALGSVLSKIPNPYTQAIGTALNVISSGLGTSTATETTTVTTTTQNTIAVSSTDTISRTALASQGGPGVGDVISYYYNVRVVWYSDGSKLRLAYLGSDGVVQVTAGQLLAAQTKLKAGKPGTVDPQWHVDLASVTALLNLDPLAVGGPSAALPPDRFVAIDGGLVIEVGGGGLERDFAHTVSRTEANTTVKTVTDVQVDKPGFLSFLGLGVTDSNTIQSQISQSSAAQSTSGQTFTQKYVFNGNGKSSYAGIAYFDVVFGSFAFREVPTGAAVAAISGTVTVNGQPAAKRTVTVAAANASFVTATDSAGRFDLRLPGIASGQLTVKSGSAAVALDYAGQPIANVRLADQ